MVTEPSKEYQYGWDEPSWVEEKPDWEIDLEREEIEKRQDQSKSRKKRGRKRKGKQSFDSGGGASSGSKRW